MAEMTIYTLAKKLNMTPSMVSRALNPEGKISEEKRRIVLAAAEKYNFRPNRLASRLSMKPIRIGVLMRSMFKVNADKMIEGIRLSHDELKDYKIRYDISVLDATASDEELLGKLESYKDADGVILSGLSASRYTSMINGFYAENPNVVQVQSVNEEANSLFSSKHDEAVAAGLAADFLFNCVRGMPRKNLLLFTGDLSSDVHSNAVVAFERSCCEKGMCLLDSVDMKDNEEYLLKSLPEVFSKYEGKIDGIYMTSGISTPLAKYLEENSLDIPFVAFDTHNEIKQYMKKGIVSAAISQNVTKQMKVAFESLVKHIIAGGECPPILYTDVNLMLKSNMHQFS